MLAAPEPLADLIKPVADGWVLENDSVRVRVSTEAGSLSITSMFNKLAGVEYQIVAAGRTLFEYEIMPEGGANSTVKSNDGGWSVGQTRFVPLTMTLHSGPQPVGRAIEVDLTRSAGSAPLAVTAVFEIYEGEAGVRFLTRVRNTSTTAKLTIVNSVVMAMGFENVAHTLHYPPNSWWKSTRGALSPLPEDTAHPGRSAEVPKKVICVYDRGDGWSFSPELNWKTQKGKGEFNNANQSMLPPWASINAWSGMQHIHVKTNPESLQLVLFPTETFDYIAVNITVFKGTLVDGKFAEQMHFRKRFRYHDTAAIFNTNDWDHRDRAGYNSYDNPGNVINGVANFYYTDVIPKAERAGFEMVMMDDHWNKDRDTLELSPGRVPAIGSFEQFTTTLSGKGFLFGLWFSLSGGNHNQGRDLADPANIAFKKAQIKTLIEEYDLAHHMIDLTEYWQNTATTGYSHASDNVYRKAVLSRNMLNEISDEYPQYRPKITSELDIFPSQTDRSTSLIHIPHNGWNTAGCGVTGEDLSIRTAVVLFGHLPMEATYINSGKMTGRMEDYYSYMFARNTKFAEDPSDPVKWPDAHIALMGVFNRWRRSPRVHALASEIWRPVFLGEGWDTRSDWDVTAGPYVWMYTNDDRSEGLVIATGKMGYRRGVSADLRWLDQGESYMVCDVTLDDSGEHTYAYRGTFAASALRAPGLPIDLQENTTRGKAFWVRKVDGRDLQVAYEDEFITSVDVKATRQSVVVKVVGTPSKTVTVIVVDPIRNLGKPVTISLNGSGRGFANVLATTLLPPVVSRSRFVNPTMLEAESMGFEINPAATEWRRVSESYASGGAWLLGGFTADNQWMEFTTNVPEAGFYRVDVHYKANESRGKSTLLLDGTQLGETYNNYYTIGRYPSAEFRERSHGLKQISAGTHKFRFVCAGTSGSKREVGVDYIKLTPSIRKSWQRFEAGDAFTAVSAGSAVENVPDPVATPANSGSWHKLNAVQAGAWVEYTVNAPAAGRYRVQTVIKRHAQRGQYKLMYQGNQVGGITDQFLPPNLGTYQYAEIDEGVITVASAGPVKLRYEVTGKASASTGYLLATDSIVLIAEPYIEVNNQLTLPLWSSVRPDVTLRDFVPQYANPSDVVWSLTDAESRAVVSLGQDGRISAIGRGTAHVRIESLYDDLVSADITVTVP